MAQRQRTPDLMPTEGEEGCHRINAGPELDIFFYPNGRRLQDGTRRGPKQPSIVVGLKWARESIIRLDPFEMEPHYHVNPGVKDPTPFQVKSGEIPLYVFMEHFFENPGMFRQLLVIAGEPDVAMRIQDGDLLGVPAQVLALAQVD